VFIDDADYSFFLNELMLCAKKYQWTWIAYCLMPNHFHLVLETQEPTLGAGMGPLTARHAQEFNRRYHPKGGHVFKARSEATIVDSDEYSQHLLRYLAFNPVAAGLCAKPEEWQWSSHRVTLLGRPEASDARSRIESCSGRGPRRRQPIREPLRDRSHPHPAAKRPGSVDPCGNRSRNSRPLA